MEVRIIDNWTAKASEILKTAIARATDVRTAVAFVSKEGIDTLWPALTAAADRGAWLEFLVGLDGQSTEPQAVSSLLSLTNRSERASLWGWDATSRGATFHPKLYIARAANQSTCLIGSSNLTKGGLRDNVEVNVLCRGAEDDEIVSQAYETYLRIKQAGHARLVDAEVLGRYEELWHIAAEMREKQRASPAYSTAEKRFREAVRRRPRVKVERKDLYGWLDLVYDVLPEGEFTNQQVYRHREIFQRRFPRNRNIEAKIRQKLQELRDLGLIEHLGPGRWRKL
ncbi:MAG: hypothetical protein H5T86_06765 [Armatimonadetes bacterium]|nr:hypothetical protein [Armatimonadota bacterium]